MSSLRVTGGLNGLNVLVGAIQTAFGPFFSVYLTQQGWSQVDIGVALSLGTAAAFLLQVPAGALVDAIDLKRIAVAVPLLLTAVSAAMVVAAPTHASVLTARMLQASAGCLLTPAVAALTLNICGHRLFSERLGTNSRYASLGSAFAAAALGGVAYAVSERAVFLVTALLAIPALATLMTIRHADRVVDDHPATLPPRSRKLRGHRPWHLFYNPALYVFAACVALFHFANAAMLPLALNGLTMRIGRTGLIVSAAIIVPQAVVVAASPLAGRLAQRFGRKPILLFALAALALRGLLFAGNPGAIPLVAIQALDGISGAVFGLAIPLIAADITHRTGYMNLAIGWFGLSASLGATMSTTTAGWLADSFGSSIAFLALALIGLGALGLVWRMLPETRPDTHPVRRTIGHRHSALLTPVCVAAQLPGSAACGRCQNTYRHRPRTWWANRTHHGRSVPA
jgi:MFS family permease